MMKQQAAGQIPRRCSGQAMIEFLIGLVGVAVLISMLLQISVISYERTGMVIETRNDMARALARGGSAAYDADYLSGWGAGADNQNYTEDDRPELGNAVGFLDGMDTAMEMSDLKSRLETPFPGNPYLGFSGSTAGSVSEAFGIFRVNSRTDAIGILPAVRRLVLGIEQLVISHEIYMPSTGSLMEAE
jgi:hypothetical protein